MDFTSFLSQYQKVPVVAYTSKVGKEPKVSVCVQTYQHAEFIRECLDGILKQVTNFTFEVLLGEDESTDGTREICIDYANKYPDKIRLFLHSRENNIQIGDKSTGRFNVLYNLFSANSKYIALCEGDDYWTDVYKLQKQVDFLEANPEYFICHHGFKVLNKEGVLSFPPDQQEIPLDYDLAMLSKRNTIGTLTVMYRNEFTLPEWFPGLNYGDYPMHLLNARNGKIKFFPEEMAVYRQHQQSVTGDFKLVESPLFLLQPLEILHSFFKEDKVVSRNLGLQVLNLYITVYCHYSDLKDEKNGDLYFDKIRTLKVLFPEKEVPKKILARVYLDRINNYIRFNDQTAIDSLIGDFHDETIEYLLEAYTKETRLSNSLKRSKSYKLGNKLIDPFFKVLSALNPKEKKVS